MSCQVAQIRNILTSGRFIGFTLKIVFLTIFHASLISIFALAFAQLPTVNLILGDGDASEAGPNPGSFVISRSDGILSGELEVRVNVTGIARITTAM